MLAKKSNPIGNASPESHQLNKLAGSGSKEFQNNSLNEYKFGIESH